MSAPKRSLRQNWDAQESTEANQRSGTPSMKVEGNDSCEQVGGIDGRLYDLQASNLARTLEALVMMITSLDHDLLLPLLEELLFCQSQDQQK